MTKEMILELARFVYQNYPLLRGQLKFWQVLSLVDKYEKNLVIVRKDNQLKGIAMYVMVDDLTIDRLKTKVYDITTPEGFEKIFERNGSGRNAHFLFVMADGIRTIMNGLRKTIKKENPISVSWFSPNMLDFNIFEEVI